MMVGLVILGVISLLFLFGLLKTVLERTQIPFWAMFIILVLFTVSPFLPDIELGLFVISPSTFLLPLVLSIAFFIKSVLADEALPNFLTTLVSVTVVLAFELLLFGQGFLSDVFASVFLGIIIGAVAFVISPSPVSALSGIMGGFVIGQAIVAVINYSQGAQMIALGAQNLFSGLIIALTCAVAISVAFTKISKKVGENIIKRSNYMSEQSEDNVDDMVFYDDFFNN